MYKKIYILLVGLFFGISFAQTSAKANIALLPLGMVNVALEARVNSHITLQPEMMVSPWKSFLGKRFQLYYFSLESRYYFRQSFQGFYIGGNFGLGLFDLKKWNYLHTTRYQRGYTLLMGATLGYQYQINDHWRADVFLGGGNSQGFYHGYNEDDHLRYEGSEPWNRSGEWLPYKGGIMLSYQLK